MSLLKFLPIFTTVKMKPRCGAILMLILSWFQSEEIDCYEHPLMKFIDKSYKCMLTFLPNQ